MAAILSQSYHTQINCLNDHYHAFPLLCYIQVIYSYDIKWEKSYIKWSNRWDAYFKGNPDDEIHYFSIVNSLMIVLFLTGVVAMIMLRTLHKDIASYNEMQTLEEAQEESGWKLVHGDVFRPPTASPILLAVLAGQSAIQSDLFSVIILLCNRKSAVMYLCDMEEIYSDDTIVLMISVADLSFTTTIFCVCSLLLFTLLYFPPGTGVQILAMTICTMVCALLGLLSPANRGGLLTALCLLFVFMGSFAGYVSARIYKLFHGKQWKQCTLLTATLYPGVMGSIFMGINGFVFYQGSSTYTPFTTLLSLLLLWFGVSTPLVFVGSYFGFKTDTISVPVRTNQIARHIPDQVWYTNPYFSIALGGILPFGAVCIELFFIMSALWLHQVN